MVSTATRANGSCSRIASRIASEIWSQTLSGCPSVTDSEVNSRSVEEVMTESVLPGHDAPRRRSAPGRRPGLPSRAELEHAVPHGVRDEVLAALGVRHDLPAAVHDG